jgi:hypothetical protein
MSKGRSNRHLEQTSLHEYQRILARHGQTAPDFNFQEGAAFSAMKYYSMLVPRLILAGIFLSPILRRFSGGKSVSDQGVNYAPRSNWQSQSVRFIQSE